MSRNLRMYYYAILGAMGGLLAWRLSDSLGFLNQPNIYLTDALHGAVTGLCIGCFIGFAEWILSQSLVRGLRSAAIGAVVGLIAGAVALPLAEWIFLMLGGQFIGRMLGWAIFGAGIGIVDGITGRSQVWKGALGGFIGGFVGGGLLELSLHQFSNPLFGKILGLMLLGGMVGIFTALIVVAMSRAWLEITSGKLGGTEFILDKFLQEGSPAAIIGSNVLKSDIALPDTEISPQHALIKGLGTHFTLQDMSVGTGTFVNGRKIEKHRLRDREKIRMGQTEMVYHEKR